MKQLANPVNRGTMNALGPGDMRVTFVFRDGQFHVRQISLFVVEGELTGSGEDASFEPYASKEFVRRGPQIPDTVKTQIETLVNRALDVYATENELS